MAHHRPAASTPRPSAGADLDLERLSVLSPRPSIGQGHLLYSVSSSRGRRTWLRTYARACQWVTLTLLALTMVASFVAFHARLELLEAGQLQLPHRDGPVIDVVGVSLKPSCVTRQAVASLNRYLQPRTIHVVTTNAEKCDIYSSFASNVECHIQVRS